MGRLEVITGPMFSGKSEELIRRLNRSKIGGKNVAAFKHAIDNRYDTEWITAHSGLKYPCFHASLFYSGPNLIQEVIGIDEVQFFGAGIVNEICKVVDAGKRVVVAGLDKDFRGEPFGSMPTLLALADDALKLTAVCHKCGEDATMTQRLIDGKPAPFSGETIQVGGLDTYEARCRNCFETA